MRAFRRRHFLLMLGAGGALGLAAAGSFRPWRLSLFRRGLHAVTRSGWALGSDVSITALHDVRAAAESAVSAAFAELEQVEQAMSLYRPASDLCRLNRQAVLDAPHPYLVDVVEKARAVSQQSDGAFDVTIQPLWDLYAEAQRSGRLPDAASIEATRRKVDWRRIEVSRSRIRLQGDGTAVTLNGIAQGYAADRVMDALRRHGIEHALVNTGEIGTFGCKETGEPWSVGIQHPRNPDAYIALARLNGRCLATSGDYATSFSADHRDNHVFDPRSGRSPDTLASASVAAPTAWEADALSTALFVLGAERGLQLLRATPGADALLVFKDGRTLATDGFPLCNS